VRHSLFLWVAIVALLCGCEDENLCEGSGPFDAACVCAEPGAAEAVEGYRDADGDGFGSGETGWYCGGGFSSTADDCDDADVALNHLDVDADGQTSCDGDCDDADAATFTGADEICDGVDNDCDGGTGDEEADADADGYLVCEGDCDDADPGVGPEDMDGDGAGGCDDPPDCDDTNGALNLDDDDGDGYSSCDGDCNDDDADKNLDDLDGDGSTTCDGDCDDDDPDLEALDADGDGYSTCDGDCDDTDPDLNLDDADGDGYSTCDGDCHDGNDTLTPGDADGDGISSCDGDCDDTDGASYPGGVEVCDGADNDCDTEVPADEVDDDGDGYLACGECDDADAHVFPEDAVTSGWARECAIWLEADTTGSEWFNHRIEQADVVYDGTMLALYFRTGYWLSEMAIGMVYTTDMTTWQMAGAGPVFEGTGDADDWDGEGVSNPAVIYDPGDLAAPYKMYFSAKSNQTGVTHIGLATSVDGFVWERYAEVDAPYDTIQVVPAGGMGELDSVYAAAPYVWMDGADTYMAYLCSDQVEVGICLATSTDGGYVWQKWDPEPGVGHDPQPLLLDGDAADWDGAMVGFPTLLDTGTARSLLYAGSDGAGWRVGAAHLPFEITDGVTKLADLSPVLEPATQADRWDSLEVYPGDGWVDGGVVSLFYTGGREDLGFDGEEVVSIGLATNDVPWMTLTEPVQPHTMAEADEVTFSGTVGDSDALDELLVVVSSELDPGVMLTTLADVNGDFAVTAPAGTFAAGGPYVVRVTVYDAGGLADETSVAFEVSP
jgi:hypothetical protein